MPSSKIVPADGLAPPPAAFKAIRSTRAFEEIATQIRSELIAGRLKVGSRLPSERALSEQFGVSRNTLREALRSLEHAGLIRLQKGASGGAFISERSGDAIITGLLDLYHLGAIRPAQLTQARIWLESIIVREACTRATPEDIAALYRNIDEAAQAHADGDLPLRASKHLEFHRILTRITDNPIMMIVMNGVLDVLHHFVKTIGDYQNTFVLPSRRRFMKHLEDGDVNAAVEEMETSLKRLQRTYMSRVEAVATHAPKVTNTPKAPPAPAPKPRAARKPKATSGA